MMKILLYAFLLVFINHTYSQSSQHITTDQGLLTNMLTTVIRDRNNYMWIGSYNGLHKHEGSRIRLYRKTGKDSASISGLEMHGLFEDRLGFIWIGTTAGLDKLDPVSGRIVHYPLRSTDSSSAFVGYIYSVFQDKEDYIWASTDAALYRLNYKTGEYRSIPFSKSENGVPANVTGYKSGVNSREGLWMHTSEGIVFYENKTGKFYHRYYNPQQKPIFNIGKAMQPVGANTDMVVDKSHNMYFITNHSYLAKYNLETGKLDSFLFQHPDKSWLCCYSLAVDKNENLWIGFRHGGVLLFNTHSHTFTPIRYSGNNSLINSNYIYSLCSDYTGHMWVTTDKGLDIVDIYNEAFQKRYLSDEKDFTNLAYSSGNMTADSTGIYIPFFDGGLMKLDTVSNTVNHWRIKDTSIKRIAYVWSDDQLGTLAAANRGIYRLRVKDDQMTFRKLDSRYAIALSKFRGDVIWVYKLNEQSIYFKKNNGNIYHYNGSDSLEKIESEGFKQLACISKNKKFLFFITPDLNLARRDLTTNNHTVYRLQEKLRSLEFSFSNPRDIADDGSGNVWITSQNGMLKYNTTSGIVTTYSTQQGLSHSFTFSVCSDSKGRIWVGSLGGVDYYDPATGRFRNVVAYTSGTYMDAFGSCIALKNDVLYFLAGNNLFRIVPEVFLSKKSIPPELKINELWVNNKPVDWQKEKLLSSLSYDQNRIHIDFSLLDFSYQPSIKYFYYLEGAEQQWIETSRPEVNYNSLSPGSYVFHAKATDASGKETGQQINLPITIHPPFWETWWFRLLILLAAAFIIYMLFRRRVKSIKNKAVIMQQMTELEAKALRAQMNPHFIFNSLNAIQELIMTKNFTEAYQYLSSFSKLLRMVLNNSEKNFIPLSSEIEMNQHYLQLESLRFSRSFSYEIVVEDSIDEDITLVPSLLLQPFLENAIWHGLMHKDGDKKLTVRFSEKDEHLLCTIEDNGIGRKRSAAIKSQKIGTNYFESKGISLSHQRIEVLNQQMKANLSIKIEDLEDISGITTGTKVYITIPKKTTFIN